MNIDPCLGCARIVAGAIGLAQARLGVGLARAETKEFRLRVCDACSPGTDRCPQCQCDKDAKASLSRSACPRNYWQKETPRV